MKKIAFLLLLMLALPMFAVSTELTKAKALVSKMERKVTVVSSEIKGKQYEVYRCRVKLELALKRIDKDFSSMHEVYSDKRTVHNNEPENEAKKRAYYAELGKMVDILLKKSCNNAKLKNPLQAYIKKRAGFRKDVAKQLKKSERSKYVAAYQAVDKAYGIK